MNDRQLLRYNRHIPLDEIGIKSQRKPLGAHAFVVGCGGLGAATLPYLATSGIGRLTIADPDAIDDTNLQRQITFTEADIDRSKALVMEGRLKSINNRADITALPERLTEARLTEPMRATDIVLDCRDNFPTRQAVNCTAVVAHTSLVSGTAMRFDGQIAIYRPNLPDSPCYVYLSDGDTTNDGACAPFDVFSPLVGIIGTTRTVGALKVLAGVGTPAHGKLVTYDALVGKQRTFRLERHPECRACGGRC